MIKKFFVLLAFFASTAFAGDIVLLAPNASKVGLLMSKDGILAEELKAKGYSLQVFADPVMPKNRHGHLVEVRPGNVQETIFIDNLEEGNDGIWFSDRLSKQKATMPIWVASYLRALNYLNLAPETRRKIDESNYALKGDLSGLATAKFKDDTGLVANTLKNSKARLNEFRY